MEKEEMIITPQDIIDREFRVKFRGFDMAEVDTFLEEVAEGLFKLNEENILLNEKILALQQELETAGALASRGQLEFPPELSSALEELKQDTSSISTELGALKQDRQSFDALRENLEKALTSLEESRAAMTSGPQLELPADLEKTLDEFKQNSETLAAELAALQEDRQAVASLKNSLEELIGTAREAVSSMAPMPEHAAMPGDLGKTLEEFKQGTETVGAELAALKQEVGAISGIGAEIKQELEEMLSSRFAALAAKLSDTAVAGQADLKPEVSPPVPDKEEKLAAAEILEEPADDKEGKRLQEHSYKEDAASGESELEFLSEDDILDVDRLRGIFQSVLDENISEGHDSREGDDVSADLLFLDEDLIEENHEPEVTFALDENNTDSKEGSEKP